MNAVAASILTVLMLIVILAPRRWALLGMMAGVIFLTQGEGLNLFGFNLFPTRCLEFAAFLRVLKRKEFTFSRWNQLDRVLPILCVYTFFVYLLRTREGVAYQAGTAADAFLCYFAFRGLLQDFQELNWFLKAFGLLLVPFLMLVWFERISGRNLFEWIGGEPTGELFRAGHPRCMGSFRHPSLMGSVGATFLSLYIAILAKEGYRRFGLLGIIVCTGIVVASNSGGPANTAAVAIVGWLIWGLRRKMRAVRWSLIAMLVLLAIVMKAPIYYLPAKVSAITGGDGYHRSYLIEMALKDLDKWFIAGIDIQETADWFLYVAPATGGADMTNNFISYGVRAGLGATGLLIVLLVISYRYLGKALEFIRNGSGGDRAREALLWGLGVMLTAHIANWFGTSYWDQFYVIWYLHLALISSLTYKVIGEGLSVSNNAKVDSFPQAFQADSCIS